MRDSKMTPVIYAFPRNASLAQKVSRILNIPYLSVEESNFPDGEFKVRAGEDAMGKTIFIIDSLSVDQEQRPGEKLCRLLFLLANLRDLGAANIHVIIPYLAFARQDRQIEPNDPLGARYAAALLESLCLSSVMTVDVHNPSSFQSAFRCRSVNLSSVELFIQKIKEFIFAGPLVIVAPDAGAVKRCQLLRKALAEALSQDIGLAMVDKVRIEENVLGNALLGTVRDSSVIIFDDMITTGKTLIQAIHACDKGGAKEIIAVATHGLFVGAVDKILRDAPLMKIVTSDTNPEIYRFEGEIAAHPLEVISIAGTLARAVARELR